jgi:hypothetical protein
MPPIKRRQYFSQLRSLSQQLVISGSVCKLAIIPTIFTPELLNTADSHYKCFKLIGLHPLCAVLFTAGYALREYGAFNYTYSTKNLIIFILSQVFIYICP